MGSATEETQPLEDVPVPVKLKLAALWTATMFMFLYGDVFTVYRADKVREILGGEIVPEVALVLLIVWFAARWPRRRATPTGERAAARTAA
jgi:cbb3-type cytochrome oxidase subunit 3